MSITPAQVASAERVQHRAAHSPSAQVRLLAGPGTGKSSSIEERVRWLVTNGQDPARVAAVSFTRASARDLEARIHLFGIRNGLPTLTLVHVSTLHALALKILRQAGLLTRFPVDPLVLDEWELRHVLDAEFGCDANVPQVTRQQLIRRDYEAFCSTGQWNPPGLPTAQRAVSAADRARFSGFLPIRAQVYSCVLPGELVKKCVDEAAAGLLDLTELAAIDHLIVDEYQDLNPVDLQFVDILAQNGVTVFVAGDDDQSVYAFRYAAPVGIQQFHVRYPGADSHTLRDCFRCTPAVLDMAYRAVQAIPDPNRLPKQVVSLYGSAVPPVQGVAHRWRFGGSRQEAEAIATSCQALIGQGVAAEQIMILLSSVPSLGMSIADALRQHGVPFEEPRPEPFCDTLAGRYGLALLRIVSSPDDYLALRTLLGLKRGVGVSTCSSVAQSIIQHNLNLGDVATAPILPNAFAGRALAAVAALRAVVACVATWQTSDTLGYRRVELSAAIQSALGPQAHGEWHLETDPLPDGMLLGELRTYIGVGEEGAKEQILGEVNARLGVAPPPTGRAGRVRIMTMHGSKGLSAQIVFIPGLEEGLMPSRATAAIPGRVAEGGRLLFVSISRARAACLVSYAERRGMQGTVVRQAPSRFAAALGQWSGRAVGLTFAEARQIVDSVAGL